MLCPELQNRTLLGRVATENAGRDYTRGVESSAKETSARAHEAFMGGQRFSHRLDQSRTLDFHPAIAV
jgi:hypothetical protein